MSIRVCSLILVVLGVGVNSAVRKYPGDHEDELSNMFQLTNDVVSMETVLQLFSQQQEQISDMQLELSELKIGNAALKVNLSNQETEIQTLKRTVLKHATSQPEEPAAGYDRRNKTGEALKRMLLDYPTSTVEPTPSVPWVTEGWSDSVVAFSARLSSGLHHYGRDEAIVFDTVITNNDYAYSDETGKFTAPVDGTYYFMVTIMCDSGSIFEAELVSDGVELIYIYAGDNQRHEQGTGGVVLQLEAGDRVWVRHHATEGSILHSWSSFSGFKISRL